MRRYLSITTAAALFLAALFFGVSPQAILAQRVLLFEDFEDATPDVPANEGVDSVDTFNRSIVTEEDPATITVTGGMFEDPFNPGNNKSLVLHNPNNAAQESVNWFSIFPDDPVNPNFFLRNGSIEFDAYLGPVIPGAYWTYLEMRFGFERDPANRNQVSTGGDETIWNSFRMGEAGLEMATDRLFDQGNTNNFVDTTDLIVVEEAMHVRYDINGSDSTYKVTIDNLEDELDPVELVWDSGTADQPWAQHFNFETFQFEPAPGINEISFFTDASVRGAGATAHSNVYIDNLLIIDNDQAPVAAPDYNNNGVVDVADYTVWRDSLGAVVTAGTGADGDGDGVIDSGDYDAWKTAFGTVVGSGARSKSVPEPGFWALLAAMIVSLVVVSCKRLAPASFVTVAEFA